MLVLHSLLWNYILSIKWGMTEHFNYDLWPMFVFLYPHSLEVSLFHLLN